eukprot:GHVT01095431.1.p1 GENE.GHVT01095431.1~~GHVT01095431.1.p1  ORF type:complete len:654 (-),score=120.59 GHVT01095431.1:87-2048(-)
MEFPQASILRPQQIMALWEKEVRQILHKRPPAVQRSASKELRRLFTEFVGANVEAVQAAGAARAAAIAEAAIEASAAVSAAARAADREGASAPADDPHAEAAASPDGAEVQREAADEASQPVEGQAPELTCKVLIEAAEDDSHRSGTAQVPGCITFDASRGTVEASPKRIVCAAEKNVEETYSLYDSDADDAFAQYSGDSDGEDEKIGAWPMSNPRRSIEPPTTAIHPQSIPGEVVMRFAGFLLPKFKESQRGVDQLAPRASSEAPETEPTQRGAGEEQEPIQSSWTSLVSPIDRLPPSLGVCAAPKALCSATTTSWTFDFDTDNMLCDLFCSLLLASRTKLRLSPEKTSMLVNIAACILDQAFTTMRLNLFKDQQHNCISDPTETKPTSHCSPTVEKLHRRRLRPSLKEVRSMDRSSCVEGQGSSSTSSNSTLVDARPFHSISDNWMEAIEAALHAARVTFKNLLLSSCFTSSIGEAEVDVPSADARTTSDSSSGSLKVGLPLLPAETVAATQAGESGAKRSSAAATAKDKHDGTAVAKASSPQAPAAAAAAVSTAAAAAASSVSASSVSASGSSSIGMAVPGLAIDASPEAFTSSESLRVVDFLSEELFGHFHLLCYSCNSKPPLERMWRQNPALPPELNAASQHCQMQTI